ncbi:MAG: hypothetical protein OXI17_16175 [Gammaproteobacteria bacterium]|nr:hypothetical protein [Gammaproteobacteria bacterium]MDE0510153.1 hypothetical protein [Gammaproteobacteria bacterium]MYE30998.1 hypothetical protein [Gammaproteobacteria bacterium]
MNELPPQRPEFSDDEFGKLVGNVKNALRALPAYFRTSTRIEGLDGGELFNLSAVLGSAIEVQVVETLNRIRDVWDPDDRWPRCRFVRSSQTFPDVRLLSQGENGRVDNVLGIELKGWYLLSKETEPSFRFTVTPDACAPQDLLVVIPWHLKNILSGEPMVHAPYIEQARYVAEFRNWWWTCARETSDTNAQRQVSPPDENVNPYPAPKTKIADRPAKDGGNNFGRIARVAGLMDSYTKELRSRPIAGIPAEHWIAFFKRHAESAVPEEILAHLTRELQKRELGREAATEIADAIARIVALTR